MNSALAAINFAPRMHPNFWSARSCLSSSLEGRFLRLSREKLSGVGRHEGVLLPGGGVAHITQGQVPHLTTLAEFQQGRECVIEDELHSHEFGVAFARLNELLAKKEPYGPLFNNCEYFAREVMRGGGISWQAVVAVGAVGGLGYLAYMNGGISSAVAALKSAVPR